MESLIILFFSHKIIIEYFRQAKLFANISGMQQRLSVIIRQLFRLAPSTLLIVIKLCYSSKGMPSKKRHTVSNYRHRPLWSFLSSLSLAADILCGQPLTMNIFCKALNVFPKIPSFSGIVPTLITLIIIVIFPAEVSSNTEHDLSGEQQHDHIPRSRRHHVQPHQHQKGITAEGPAAHK